MTTKLWKIDKKKIKIDDLKSILYRLPGKINTLC